MPLGDFTASHVPMRVTLLDQAWADAKARNNTEFLPRTGTFDAVVSQDTATLDSFLTLPNTCQGVKLIWMEHCEEDSGINTSPAQLIDFQSVPCTFTGKEAESKAQVYQIRSQVYAKFSVYDDECDNFFGTRSKVELLSMIRKRELAERVNNYVFNQLHNFAGANPFNGIDIAGNVANGIVANTTTATVTKLPEGNINYKDLPAYLGLLNRFNRFNSPVLLDGGNLLFDQWTAQYQRGTQADFGQSGMLGTVPYRVDEAAFLANNKLKFMYLLDKGAVSFVSRNMNSTTPQTIAGTFKLKWAEPLSGLTLPNGEPVMMDVYYIPEQKTIAGTNRCRLMHNWYYEVYIDTYVNPTRCSDGVTGVIEFQIDPTATQVCAVAPCTTP